MDELRLDPLWEDWMENFVRYDNGVYFGYGPDYGELYTSINPEGFLRAYEEAREQWNREDVTATSEVAPDISYSFWEDSSVVTEAAAFAALPLTLAYQADKRKRELECINELHALGYWPLDEEIESLEVDHNGFVTIRRTGNVFDHTFNMYTDNIEVELLIAAPVDFSELVRGSLREDVARTLLQDSAVGADTLLTENRVSTSTFPSQSSEIWVTTPIPEVASVDYGTIDFSWV